MNTYKTVKFTNADEVTVTIHLNENTIQCPNCGSLDHQADCSQLVPIIEPFYGATDGSLTVIPRSCNKCKYSWSIYIKL